LFFKARCTLPQSRSLPQELFLVGAVTDQRGQAFGRRRFG
jgi:hypothetical protein